MKLHKRHSFFPLVVVLLTLGLIVFMFFAFTDSEKKTVAQPIESISIVSTEDYQKDMKQITNDFISSFESVESDLSRLVLTQETLSALLMQKVPGEYKEVHLALAIQLNLIQDALGSETGDVEESYLSFEELVNGQEWLK